MNLASIPSPSDGVWHLGPLPLRAYALAIILGIIVAIWVGERRFVARGGRPGVVSDVAVWAIPFGLVGARAYHVATNPEFYFGDGKDPVQALYVWEGGLGIWGAIAFGALGAYLGCRFSRVRFTSYIDAVAPGVVLAQAIGRWGNYFNQELMGKPTDRPWAVEIDLDNRPEGYLEYQTFHPTFLYESLWCIGIAIALILADRRWKLGRGRVFALYVALYTVGRAWIENLRIDDAHEFGPFRLNVWVSLAVFVVAVAYFVILGRLRPGREESVLRAGAGGDAGGGSDADGEADGDDSLDREAGSASEDADAESANKDTDEDKDKAESDQADAKTEDDKVKDEKAETEKSKGEADAEKAEDDKTGSEDEKAKAGTGDEAVTPDADDKTGSKATDDKPSDSAKVSDSAAASSDTFDYDSSSRSD